MKGRQGEQDPRLVRGVNRLMPSQNSAQQRRARTGRRQDEGQIVSISVYHMWVRLERASSRDAAAIPSRPQRVVLPSIELIADMFVNQILQKVRLPVKAPQFQRRVARAFRDIQAAQIRGIEFFAKLQRDAFQRLFKLL